MLAKSLSSAADAVLTTKAALPCTDGLTSFAGALLLEISEGTAQDTLAFNQVLCGRDPTDTMHCSCELSAACLPAAPPNKFFSSFDCESGGASSHKEMLMDSAV